jgi:hypothetical protein
MTSCNDHVSQHDCIPERSLPPKSRDLVEAREKISWDPPVSYRIRKTSGDGSPEVNKKKRRGLKSIFCGCIG